MKSICQLPHRCARVLAREGLAAFATLLSWRSPISTVFLLSAASITLLTVSPMVVRGDETNGDADPAVIEKNHLIASALKLLEANCVECHNEAEKKGQLDLSTREALLLGGQCGNSIELGQPDDSYLIQMIRHESDPFMPFKKPKMADKDIALLARWVELGAPYDRKLQPPAKEKATAGFTIAAVDRQHWAFQPIVRSEIPQFDASSANPIDQFIFAKLREKQLNFSPEASRELLIRRVTFDLIGLPPTPQETDAFLKDKSPNAYEKLIDRLLASPHYGERWGRHWLDLARYAETDGYEHDTVRPNSWRYRDYVVQSLNEDKSYDRFIQEQLAGDELWPNDPDALVATGFNLLGPDMVDSSDQVQRRLNTLNDMTDTTSLVFLGLTIGCARCHDHKFEPLSQKDYYSLQAYFASAEFNRQCCIATADKLAKHARAMEEYNAHPLVQEVAAVEEPIRAQLREKKMAALSPEAITALNTPTEKRTTEQINLVIETEPNIAVSEKEMLEAMDDGAKGKRESLMEQVRKIPRPRKLPTAAALVSGTPAKTFVLNRGEYTQPGEEVLPTYPEILRENKNGVVETPSSHSDSSNPSTEPATESRTELAKWIASAENPLTARVMVNRIWRQHFGQGLVGTPSNFGTNGLKPTHPELLDWLAAELIEQGWSLKAMHRLMLTSRTYRQVSTTAAISPAQQDDRENSFYWRMNRIRLEGEAIRDSLLAVSGKLEPKMGGPGVFPPLPAALFKGSKGGWNVSEDERDHARRSIYIFARRNLRFPFLEVFDAPDSNLSCPTRECSTTAPQSLTLLNSEEVAQAAQALAERLQKEAASQDDQISLAFRLSLGRAPTDKELAMSKEFLASAPLNELCRALFNTNDFVYIE